MTYNKYLIPWLVICAKCTRTVRGENTRLFWEQGGTFRICKNPKACERIMKERESGADSQN